MATLVLSAIGDDRPGLVDALAARIAGHGGNWDRSHMAQLAGKFAGIVVVTLPDEQVEPLTDDLETLRGLLDVRVSIASGDGLDHAPTLLRLHLIGQDRPGIVREIANALARRDVSIEELATSTSSAPMSAEALFEADATLRVPRSGDVDDLRATLEEIANELMVDLDVADASTDEGR
jgi:glycine cleavage system regulatory protein